MTAISERQRAQFNIYKKQKNAKRFYIQKSETSQKARQFPLRFYLQKYAHFVLLGFSLNF